MISVFGSKVGAEEIAQVSESINAQWLGMGPKLKQFETEFKQRSGLGDFLMVDSGSNALYLAVKLLGLPAGSEVIVPSFTWISCAHAVVLAGCKPVFCDVDADTMNVRAEDVKRQMTDRTKAVMVVHYAGLPVEMDEILALGLPVIEDAAHAVDGYYRGKVCGGIGDVGIYSFDAVKNLAVGEGGGITAREPEHMALARKLRYCGIEKSGFEASSHGKQRWWEYNIAEVFIKMNPSDIAAGMGLAQLRKLDGLQAARKNIWDYYQEEFKSVPWLKRPEEAAADCKHGLFSYSLRALNGKRDALAHYLLKNEIYSTLRYHPLHLNAIYGQTDIRLANCERLNEEALSIPLHPNMSMADAEKVAAAVKGFA